MLSIDDIKKKREMYERKIEDTLEQFKEELPPEVKIESAVAIGGTEDKGLECRIKLVVEDLNK